MTDVTGFGLAGHLQRMAFASGVTAEIDLDAVPLMAGAEALAQQGVRSSIHRANREALLADIPETPRGALLSDPQTAGGFLASVPQDRLDALLSQGGAAFRVIGRMLPLGPAPLRLRG